MQEVVANLDHVKFDIEYAIERQLGVQSLPFTGMDKSGASVCTFFKINLCQRGANCPFRHVRGDKAVVCKHWLRGLCKKGDQCEFLHEYDMSKMPECYFYARFGRCDNKDCQYQHIDPADKIKDCPWYDRGFCRHGALCKHRHRRKVICMNYLVGFCPDGPQCKFTHPLWELPIGDKQGTKCRSCSEYGHKSNACPNNSYRSDATPDKSGDNSGSGLLLQFNKTAAPMQPNVAKLVNDLFEQRNRMNAASGMMNRIKKEQPQPQRDMSRITCFRCGQKGHYASRCMENGGLFGSVTSTRGAT